MRFENLYWQYKGLIETMSSMPGMYGLDQKRTDLHKEIEALFPGKEEAVREVLHNLDTGMDHKYALWGINNIEKFREVAKQEGRHYAP